MTKRITAVLAAGVLVISAGALFAQEVPERIRDIPRFEVQPVLDGDRFSHTDEWTGAYHYECSISQILREGAEYGWRDVELQRGEISANQLNQSEGEDGAEALTDADVSGNIWHGWDEEAFFYIAEVRDNVRDVVGGGGNPVAWWERDSISLYLDVLNEKTGGDITGEYINLNIVNFVAAPMNSSEVTRTLENTVQGGREQTQDPDLMEGLEYGWQDRGDEYGGEADYSLEGKISWSTLVRAGNLPQAPSVGSEMGFSWIILDPDGDEAYGGQILCEGWASEAANYATMIFTDNRVGPAEGTATAVESDSWARIKASFDRQ